ncbi:MAG TPA: ABC transporter ATP-binding protein [Burkholderiales bacterium]|nr:ABC transporter ATP-binding protein [Burkholderiales bacterium]
MGYIRARDIVVQFVVYGLASRSLKKSLIRAATGGALARDAGDRVVVKALDRVSLEIREGERIGLMGHNGSGKTTLLRVLAGAYEPIAGDFEIRGSVVSMLSVTLGMDPDATGLENIFLRGAVMGLSRKYIEQIVDEIAAFAELGDYIYMPLRTYSSGMSMRLAFATATAVSSDIILMDEWLSVGDADFSSKAQARLNQLVSNAKIVVLASHDASLLTQNCTRIVRLDHGRIVEDRQLSP